METNPEDRACRPVGDRLQGELGLHSPHCLAEDRMRAVWGPGALGWTRGLVDGSRGGRKGISRPAGESPRKEFEEVGDKFDVALRLGLCL